MLPRFLGCLARLMNTVVTEFFCSVCGRAAIVRITESCHCCWIAEALFRGKVEKITPFLAQHHSFSIKPFPAGFGFAFEGSAPEPEALIQALESSFFNMPLNWDTWAQKS